MCNLTLFHSMYIGLVDPNFTCSLDLKRTRKLQSIQSIQSMYLDLRENGRSSVCKMSHYD